MDVSIAKARFVVVSDEGDWSWTGHNHFYSISVARAAAADGCEAMILAPIDAREVEEEGVRILPYIVPQTQLVGVRQTVRQLALKIIPIGASQGVARFGRNALSLMFSARNRFVRNPQEKKTGNLEGTFGAQIAQAINKGVLRLTDIVFVHTILTQSLESLLHALEPLNSDAIPNLRLTLRTDPSEIASRHGRRLTLTDILNQFWANSSLRERVVFLTDTEELKNEYEKLSPFRFSTIPIPVAIPLRTETRAEGPLTLTYVGAMRRERGFHLLPKLARHISEQHASSAVRLVVQAGGAAHTDDPQVAKVLDELKLFANCTDLIVGSVPPQRYAEILHKANIVVLPYEGERYRSRSSGVMAEALVLGLPTIVPSSTWMARVGGLSSVQIPAGEPAEALCRAADLAIEKYSTLRKEAIALSEIWRGASALALFRVVSAL